MATKIVLLTSRYWEGSYVFMKFLEHGVPCQDVLIQKTWWRRAEENSFNYSAGFDSIRSAQPSEQKYRTIEELAEGRNINLHYIENINSMQSCEIISTINPLVLAVVGSRIIKKRVLDLLPERIINFHTGILPFFRGPYSEFWAFYEDKRELIGTTIHLVDAGIDTGHILAVRRAEIGTVDDPQEAHVLNAIQGAELMAQTMNDFLDGRSTPLPQDESFAVDHSYPTDEEIASLEKRLKHDIRLYFAD